MTWSGRYSERLNNLAHASTVPGHGEALTKKFPDVPPATIAENVSEAYQKFEAVPSTTS